LLEDAYHIRGNLRDVRTAVREGRFHGDDNTEKRVALLAALETLQRRPDLSDRAAIGIVRVQLEMGIQDVR
jgi:hypothetical protein